MPVARRPELSELLAHSPRLTTLDQESAAALTPRAALDRLPDAYFESYPLRSVARHVELLCSLTVTEPWALDAARMGSLLELTIVTVDHPGILGLLTGILGAAGLDIRSGSVYTLLRDATGDSAVNKPKRGRQPAGRARSSSAARGLPARRIVDRFVGAVREDRPVDAFFTDVAASLDRVIPLIVRGADDEQARRIVNEAVAERLRTGVAGAQLALLPLQISFEPGPQRTRMVIDGEDTPFFLYALSTALSLRHISIESVTIETRDRTVSDVFDLVDRAGNPIHDATVLDQIRFSVLLTKQFTYFLDRAPDPYGALVRFETMSRDLVGQSERAGIESLLSEPAVLQELARILGASDFLWEDFIRLQYESIVPMLSRRDEQLSHDGTEIEVRVAQIVKASADTAEARRALNELKDREAFLIDLDHILHHERDFFFLSDRLSTLAEIVIRAMLDLAWRHMTAKYGVPRTVAGIEAAYAVFGLGKLGGRALGYASDIELLCVYGDSGSTDGAQPIANAEFFERFFQEAAGAIESRREGIFRVDLRLRPYGQAGPLAVSLESFNRYYGRGGDAHSYEKLALTRLRFIAGRAQFGERVERLRDALIYSSESIDLAELRALREKQLAEKAAGERLNAKFSPGALVDLEYGLQVLLVQHGRTNPRLRTPSLHAALEELQRCGLMEQEETSRLVRSYRFLRSLINGLRMLRGNAQDLYLPPVDSLEYAHLARRAGFTGEGDLSPSEQLHVEFEARTAAVRAFLETHLGREQIPGPPVGNAADLVLSRRLDPAVARRITGEAGITDHERAVRNLIALGGQDSRLETFTELVVLAWTALRSTADPDRALNNWERFVSGIDEAEVHYRALLRQPRMLELMLQVFSTSQFLADTLIRHPSFLRWSLDPQVVARSRDDRQMRSDLESDVADPADSAGRGARIRVFRKREILRIGTRDLCLRAPLAVVTGELAALARAILQYDLDAVFAGRGVEPDTPNRFCILGFGKLGGNELNYSSDIDLLGIYREDSADHRERDQRLFGGVLAELRHDLAGHTEHGHAYRVDFRLRPYGSSGPLVQPLDAALRYYQGPAGLWEHQALLKLTPVAGNLDLGREFLERLEPVIRSPAPPRKIRENIARLRAIAVGRSSVREGDVKSGEGGIRDIEFLVQGLQLEFGGDRPRVRHANTIVSLARLAESGIITAEEERALRGDYEHLRRVEHYLQIFEDRQVHHLPEEEAAVDILARRLGGTGGPAFTTDLTERRHRVRALFQRYVDGEWPPTAQTSG